MSFEIQNLTVRADGRDVTKDISLSVKPGEAIAILGANGAGKSELVLGVAGMLQVAGGEVLADSKKLTNLSPDKIRAAGVAAVPEGHRVLTRLTVDENLRAAGALLSGNIEDALSEVYARFPELAERKNQLAGSLSGGQQQMVALSHALMCQPKYLLLDEMSLGLAPVIVNRLMGVVEELKTDGVGIVLIEQFTDLALKVCDQAIVLRGGSVTFSGAAKVLQNSPETLDNAYFG